MNMCFFVVTTKLSFPSCICFEVVKFFQFFLAFFTGHYNYIKPRKAKTKLQKLARKRQDTVWSHQGPRVMGRAALWT